MRDKLLIVGAGGLGRVVLELAEQEYDCAFLDDDPDIEGTVINGAEVAGRIRDLEMFYPEYSNLVVL